MRYVQPSPAGAPDVSVLVLAFNHAGYITECLNSILEQDFVGTVEVLVGEDQSSDGTADIVQDFATRFPDVVRVVTAITNVGMHANNRRLIKAARGRYIAYCEGDDLWHRRDKLSLQVALLDAHPDVVGVHSDVDHLTTVNGQRVLHHSYWRTALPDLPNLLRYEDLIARNSVQTCSVMIRTHVVATFPQSYFALGLYPMEDWPLFLHALESGPLMYISDSLATYRHVQGSATRRDIDGMVHFSRGERRLIDDASKGRAECAAARIEGLGRVRGDLVHLGLAIGDPAVVREAISAGRTAHVPETYGTHVVGLLMSIRWVGWLLPRAVRVARGVKCARDTLRRPCKPADL